ncbi:hypothetical protein NPS01_18120 [Nocardioides psychrotolerans]|nr:hypothetical protein NPS01_18120 [Nocardioides psychrotolerans]
MPKIRPRTLRTRSALVALVALAMLIGAPPAGADDSVPQEPAPTDTASSGSPEPSPTPTTEPTPEAMPTEPSPTPEAAPESTPGATPTPEPTTEDPAPVPVLVDTQQPPTPVAVLPRRCVGAEVMPDHARACRVLAFDRRRPTVVVWGDSHSWQQTPAIIAAARAARLNLVTFQLGACPPMLLTANEASGECSEIGRLAMRFIKAKVADRRKVIVVLGGYWRLYRDLSARPDPALFSLSQQARLWSLAGDRVFRSLDRMPVRTVGIGQQPTLGYGTAKPTADLPRAAVMPDEASERAWLRKRVDRRVEPSSVLCGPATCRTTVGGRSTYLDALHINPAVSGIFTPLYRAAFRP